LGTISGFTGEGEYFEILIHAEHFILPRTYKNSCKYTSYFPHPIFSSFHASQCYPKTHKNSLETKELRTHKKILK